MRHWFALAAVLALLIFGACSEKTTPPPDPPDEQPEPPYSNYIEFQAAFGEKFEELSESLGRDEAIAAIYDSLRSYSDFVSTALLTDQGINIVYTDGSRGGIFMEPEDMPTVVSAAPKRNRSKDAVAADDVPLGERAIFICPIYSERRFYADSILTVMESELLKVGFSTVEAVFDDECTMERFANLDDAGILHIYTHALAWPTKSRVENVYIMTGQRYWQVVAERYSKLFKRNALVAVYVPGRGNIVFMNQAAFSDLNSFHSDRTFVFLSCGYTAEVNWMVNLRFGDGAGCCLGYDWITPADSNLRWATELYKDCCDTTVTHELSISDWLQQKSAVYMDETESLPASPRYCRLRRTSLPGYALWHAVRITDVQPDSATIGGSVSIHGVGFGGYMGGSTVSFSGVEATVFSWSDAEINTQVPNGATSGDVTIDLPIAMPISYPFIIYDKIRLLEFSARFATYGDTVSLIGEGFGDTRSDGVVLFDDIEAEIVAWSDTFLTCVVPEGLRGSNVWVRREGAVSSKLRLDIIAIDWIEPRLALYDSWVTLHGPNILSSEVYLDTSVLASRSAGYNTLVAFIASRTRSGYLRVERSGFRSNPVWIEILGIDSIRPNPCGELTPLTIYGQNLGDDGTVTLGERMFTGIERFWFEDSIGLVTPQGVRSGDIRIHVHDMSTRPVYFRALRIEELRPNSGNVGDTISIIGENFLDYRITNRVLLDEIEAVIRYWSDTLVWMEIPPDAESGSVRLQSRGQLSNPKHLTLLD